MKKSDIAAAVQEARADAELTQAQLAEAAGISRTALANIERGISYPSLITRRNLTAALGKPAGWLSADAAPDAPANPVSQAYAMGYAYGLMEDIIGEPSASRRNNCAASNSTWLSTLSLAYRQLSTLKSPQYEEYDRQLRAALHEIDIDKIKGASLTPIEQGGYVLGYYAYKGEKEGTEE